MSIRRNGEGKHLRKAGLLLGREGISLRAIALILGFDGSYKDAMRLAGALKAIAIMSECDEYWHEQMERGYNHELDVQYVCTEEPIK